MYDPLFGLSVSFKGEATPEEMVRQLRRFAFTALELNAGYIERHGTRLSILRREFEYLTYHLPQQGEFSALSPDAGDDARVLEHLKGQFDLATAIGCRTFTFHLKNPLGQRIEQYWSRSVDFARRLGTLAGEYGVLVGLENCYSVVRSGEVARRFLDEVASPAVGLTLDTGHFWSALCEDEFGHHREDPVMRTPEGDRLLNRMCCEMARAVGDRIVNIHIHNVRAGDWLDHQPVDAGVMCYDKFFQILRDIGYQRTVIVEIRPTEGWVGFESSARYLQQFRKISP